MDITLELSYTAAQDELFWKSSAKKRIVRKGRRLGFTQGAAQFVIESMLAGRYKKVLWGDTIHRNIRNYVERYFMPVLKQLPPQIWQWRVSDKLLSINGAVCDFRSADNPENWEGFAYDLVILNEAGIILKNRYLWENAVAPMLIDNPDSVAIIGGTPKGKGLLYELYQRASGESAEFKDWQSFAFTTYDNPFLTKSAIDEFIRELGGSIDSENKATENIIRQEIYGEFIDSNTNELFKYSDIIQAMSQSKEQNHKSAQIEVWGIDVARQGTDQSVLAKRRDNIIYELMRKDTPDLMAYADYIAQIYSMAERKPDAIFVEINGIGAGLYDRLASLGLPVIPADVASRAMEGKIFNKRSEMYKTFASAVRHGVTLPDDRRLQAELCAIEYEIRDDGIFKIAAKDLIRKKLGYSPDSADACALSYFAPVQPRALGEFYDESLPTGAW